MTQSIAVLSVLYLMQNIIYGLHELADIFSCDPSYQNHVVFRDVPYTFGKSPGPRGQNTSSENCSFTSRFFGQTRKTGHIVLKTHRSSNTKMKNTSLLIVQSVWPDWGGERGDRDGAVPDKSVFNQDVVLPTNTTIESDNDDICSLLNFKAYQGISCKFAFEIRPKNFCQKR